MSGLKLSAVSPVLRTLIHNVYFYEIYTLHREKGAVIHEIMTLAASLELNYSIIHSWTHRRRMETEAKAKVFASVWGTVFI